MDYDEREVARGGTSADHPAHYDQKTAEVAEQIQKADAYILYLHYQDGEEDSHSHVVVGRTPGVRTGEFLYFGAKHVMDLIQDVAHAEAEGKEWGPNGKTEG